MSDINAKINTLKLYDDAYFNGIPLISDVEYDTLKESIRLENPTHVYFALVGSDVRGGKIDLPFPMGSLDQVYDQKDIDNWLHRYNIHNNKMVLSHKLDGVSCMIQYENGKLKIAYSRGNGIQGADITRHISKIPSIPKKIPFKGELTIRNEVIMKNDVFNSSYSNDFKNPRNLVAGAMNRKETKQSILNDISIISYDIVFISDDLNEDLTKTHALELLEEWGFDVVKYDTVKAQDLQMDILRNTLKQFKDDSEYELDGMVITNIDYLNTGDRKSQSLNPTHSVKFKVLDKSSIVKTSVVNVLWEISKSGYLKPRIEVKPVELFGTTVKFATGFNGKFIYDNKIGIDTIVEITKSGSVIPYIVSVVKGTKALMPSEVWEWNESKIECVVSLDNEVVIFKQCLDFFVSLDVELLKEASLTKMFDSYKLWGKTFNEVCTCLFDLTSLEWIQVLGVNGGKSFESLHRRLSNMTYEKIMGSLPFIGFGFGIRKAKQLLQQVPFTTLSTLKEEDIENLEGFDTITASKIVQNLPLVLEFIDCFNENITFIQNDNSSEMKNVVIVMSGFRDKALQEQIESMGGRVSTSVSSKTTHLLTPDINGTSSKIKKAKSLNIEVITPRLFKDSFNL
jgi:NAD-dependent DNA ligase